MDLGANWANTLRLHDVLLRHVRQTTLYPEDVASFHNCTHQWEIYSFEASPVMQPFVEAFVNYLNGNGHKPPITVPPVGGSIQMLGYAKHFGCPSRHNRSEYRAMYDCMNRIFREPYSKLTVDQALNSTVLIRNRLHEASTPNLGALPRYTFVPAAVGEADGSLDVSWPSGLLLGVDTGPPPISRPPGVPADMRVSVVDWVSWVKRHFHQQDIVVVKMDVEGAEHAMLQRMMQDASIKLIDVLGIECHGKQLQCKQLLAGLTEHGIRTVSEAAYSPQSQGIDPFSHHRDTMPIDPRPSGR